MILLLFWNIPLSLLFLLSSNQQIFVAGISICSTPIHLSTGQTIPFHVENEEDLIVNAQYFCLKNYIGDLDCQRILKFHQEKCFPKKTGEQENLENQETVEIEKIDKIEKIDNGHETGKVPNEIDYSQRVGPVLAVYHQDLQRNLQAYLGETPQETVKRFCGMLKLNSDECDQVREAYLKLLDPHNLVGSEDERTEGGKDKENSNDETTPSSSAPFSQQQQQDVSSEKTTSLVSQIEFLLRNYWNYLTLLLALIYVILENPIQL